jgi:predicted HTH transcriptional regulator
MRLVEQIGSGISRIIHLMKEATLPAPLFQKEGMFTVTLMRPLKSREKIKALIKENPNITTMEMSEIIGISIKGIEKHIANLKKEGIIDRIGADKGGNWKILIK